MPRFCPRCFRTTDQDMEECPNNGSPLPCPPPVDATDEKVLVVKCSACPKLRAIPIGNIMQRKRLTELGLCVSDQCKAEIILPSPTPAVSKPPPIAEETREQFRVWDREGIEAALERKDISQEAAERLLIEVDSAGK